MPYVRPTLNVAFNYWGRNVWYESWPDYVGPPDFTVNGQLRAPSFRSVVEGGINIAWAMELLVPLDFAAALPDYQTGEWWYWMPRVEVPAGSGCYYFLNAIWPVALGFGNSYKVLYISPTWSVEGEAYSSAPNWPYAPAWPRIPMWELP